jgi:molybdopterin/thiamine biosynthesis adenylyltransferase
MRDIGNRHSGTAGGALNPGGKPVSVEVRLGEDADLSSTQHTVWMLLNLLCRLTGAVREVRLRCSPQPLAISKLSPYVKRGLPLAQALLEGIQAIGAERDGFVRTEIANGAGAEIIISVGYQIDPEATFCAIGNGSCGGLFSSSINPPTSHSDSTIGPYIAACLATGEIFRSVRLVDYEPQRQIFLDATSHSHSSDPIWNDIDYASEFAPVLLAGMGAVGTALLHALYPLPIRGTIFLADNDPKGIEDTNLGRYSLFGLESIGKQKATEASRLLREAAFATVPNDGGFEYFFDNGNQIKMLLSAVDTNESRHALQERYVPLAFSASTLNLRAEVLRCGPPEIGACLSCFNPVIRYQRTEDDIRQLLLTRPTLMLKLTQKLKLSPTEVMEWLHDRRCSETGERLVEELRTDDGSVPAFSVSFVSVLAGTLLAAELLKVASGYGGPLSDDKNRAVFQFQNPSALTNRASFYPRDENCQACSSQNVGAGIWANRYRQFAAQENERLRL